NGSNRLTITGNTKGPSGQAGATGNDTLTLTNTKASPGQVGAPSAATGNKTLTITGNTKGPSGQVGAPAAAATGNNTLTISGNTKGSSGQTAATGNDTLTLTNTKGPSGQAAAPGAAAVGAGAGPVLGPMKTESSGGPQTLGSATSANVIGAPCPQPKIQTISGFPMAIFSPGELFNPYTIKGCGFGWQMGHVYMTGAFNAGKIELKVEMTGGTQKSPARAAWSDTTIVVTVDPNLSGELDHNNVTLVVEPVSGPPIQKSGNDFLAARETVALHTIPQSAVQFTQPLPTPKSVSPSIAPSSKPLDTNPQGFALLYFT